MKKMKFGGEVTFWSERDISTCNMLLTPLGVFHI